MELKKIHISDIGKVVTGKTPRTSVAENYGGDIPFLTPSDNLSHKSAPKTIKTLTKQGLNEVKNCLLPPQSVCVSCIGSDLGKVVMTVEPTVTNQQFNSIVPNENFNADFVYYLMSQVGKELNYLSKTSTAVPIINKSSFSNYEVEVPSLKVQEKIASILASLDSKIELNRRINDNLEQQAQALFKSWFVDFEPFGSGSMPDDWEICEAQKYFKINIGKTPPRNETKWFSKNIDDYKWASIADLGKCGLFISNTSEYLTKEAVNTFNIIIVPKGTVLLSFKLTLGRTAITTCPLTTNEAIARFLVNNDYEREYLYLLLRQYDYTSLGNTSSIATAVNSKIIKNMPIMMPPIDILQQFHTVVSPLFNRMQSLSDELTQLAETRDTLLPRLMSGELKISETETQTTNHG